MSGTIQIILYGSLRNRQKISPEHSNEKLALTKATPLENILRRLDIQYDKVQLVMRNHRAVLKDIIVNPGDRLALFPVEYPIFADWNDFRY